MVIYRVLGIEGAIHQDKRSVHYRKISDCFATQSFAENKSKRVNKNQREWSENPVKGGNGGQARLRVCVCAWRRTAEGTTTCGESNKWRRGDVTGMEFLWAKENKKKKEIISQTNRAE